MRGRRRWRPQPQTVLAAIVWGVTVAGGPAVGSALPLDVDPGDRVLIVAPHPDDETIAAGGVVPQWRAAGIDVQVVYLTCGDGWDAATAATIGGRSPTPADYLAIGRRRQGEAHAATATLGLAGAAVRFLGFPDDALDVLWAEAWAGPAHRSARTGVDRVPYPEAVRPDAAFTGEEVVAALAEILAAVRPALVLVPHPDDTHGDHWAAPRFVAAALVRLRGRGVLPRKVRRLTYLVHAYDWPATAAPATGPMVPPTRAQVAATRWTTVRLDAPAVGRKQAALAAHATQLAVSRPFLESFVRTTEVFGRVQSKRWTEMLREHRRPRAAP